MDAALLADLTPEALKTFLPVFLASKVDGQEADRVSEHVADWSDSDYADLLTALQTHGAEHRVYAAVPACRALSRSWMPEVFEPVVNGAENLRGAIAHGRTIVITNHMSYVDAVATDVALSAAGHADLADLIIYLAGPKVYQEVFRMVAAASIHSLPVPQSNTLGHTEHLSVRELARRARKSLDAGKDALEEGKVLLFYPEGSRTRTGRMGSFLRATRRYLQAADVVVPAAINGTDRVMPLSSNQMHPGRVELTFGEPIVLGEGAGAAREALEATHGAVGRLLPEDLRPDPDMPAIA